MTDFPYAAELATLAEKIKRVYEREGKTPYLEAIARDYSRVSLLRYKYEHGISITASGPPSTLADGSILVP